MGKSAAKASQREADRARAEEQERQARVRQGTADINSIFDGRLVGSGAVTGAFDPNKTYYQKDGSAWKPAAQTAGVPGAPARAAATATPFRNTGMGGVEWWDPQNIAATNASDRAAATAATPAGPTAAEQFAQMVGKGGLFSGQDMAGGFNDDFYRGIRDNFTNYAMPQLNQQRDDAAKDLTFALDRSGQLAGSVRGQKSGELQRLFDLNEQQVRDQALGYENQARTSVENSRADLIGMLNATGDNQQAVNSALSRSTVLTQPQQYSPLGQLFTDFTSQLGGQAARERAEAMSGGMYKAPFNTGLFGGAGRVTVR